MEKRLIYMGLGWSNSKKTVPEPTLNEKTAVINNEVISLMVKTQLVIYQSTPQSICLDVNHRNGTWKQIQDTHIIFSRFW